VIRLGETPTELAVRQAGPIAAPKVHELFDRPVE
jgi:hypothetical protein